MRTHVLKHKSDSGKGAFKKPHSDKLIPRKAAKKDSESVVYSKKEELKILNEFFTQPNYFDDFQA